MPLVVDAIYRAWRPRDFMIRVVVLFVGSFGLVSLVGRGVVVESEPAVILGLLAAVTLVFSVPAILVVTTATALVRVAVDRDAVVLTPLSRSALRPDLDVRIPTRGLVVSWHRDDSTTNLVLRSPGETAISLASSERGVLDELAKALAGRGVAFDGP